MSTPGTGAALASPLPAGPGRARPLPVPFSRCPHPRCGAGQRIHRGSRRRSDLGGFVYLFSLRKGVKKEKCRAPRRRALLGGAALARVRSGHTWARRLLAAPALQQSPLCPGCDLRGLAALWGTLPLVWGPAQFPRGMRGRRTPGALSETRK